MKLRLSSLLTTLVLTASAFGTETTPIDKKDATWYDNDYFDNDTRYCSFDYCDTNLELSKSVLLGNTFAEISWLGDADKTYTLSGSGAISAEGVNWGLGEGTYIFSNTGTIARGENNIFSGDVVIIDTAKPFDQVMSIDTLIIRNSKTSIEFIDGIDILNSERELASKNIGNLIGGASKINANVLVNGVGPDHSSIWLSPGYYKPSEIAGNVTFKSKTPVSSPLCYDFTDKPTEADILHALSDLNNTTILTCSSFTGNPGLLDLQLEYTIYNENTDYYRYNTISCSKFGTFIPVLNLSYGYFAYDIVFKSFVSAKNISTDDIKQENGYARYEAKNTDLYLSKNITLSPSLAVFKWQGNGKSWAILGKGTISAKKSLFVQLYKGAFTLASGCSFKNADYQLNETTLTFTQPITANSLTLEDSTLFNTGNKFTVKGDINVENSELVSKSTVTASSISTENSIIRLTTTKAAGITLSDKNATNKIVDTSFEASGKLSVSGNLRIDNDSFVYLYDPSGKNKAQSLTVKGSLNFGGMSKLQLNGSLSAKDLTLGSGNLTLYGAKLSTIKVGNSLTLEGGTILNFGFSVTEKDVAKRKSFKVITFKTIDNSITVININDWLSLGTDAAILDIDSKSKAITLTVTDADAWNEYAESVRNGTWDASISADEVFASSPADADAALEPALAKVADTLVQSTWGTVGASRAFGDTIANRGAHATLLDGGKGSAWISTMGGSSRISSDAGHAGADYTLAGAAFGMEAHITDDSTLGIAVGNSWGKVSTFSAYPVDQDSTHAGIYGNHRLNDTLSLSWMATHTRTESDVNLAGLPCSWSQDALQLDTRLTWTRFLDARTTVSAFGGLQYLATDSGECNGIKTGSLQNLRVEVGVGATHRFTGNTVGYGELSFIGDVVRNNPTADLGGIRAHGSNPGRAGLNLSVGASHRINEDWSVNASYNFELMQNSTSHGLNVGATYNF